MADTTLERTLTLPSDQDASGRTLGSEELEAVRRVLESGVLNSTKGTVVHALEEAFALAASRRAAARPSRPGQIDLGRLARGHLHLLLEGDGLAVVPLVCHPHDVAVLLGAGRQRRGTPPGSCGPRPCRRARARV